jgi:hypothetical protein
MTIWLDDLLEAIPADPCPPDLTARIRTELMKTRSRFRWIERGMRLIMVVAGMVGLWLIVPWVGGLVIALPSISLSDINEWLNAFISSPGDVLVNGSEIAFSWVTRSVAGFKAEFILALILLATPALYGGASLLSRQETQEGAVA